MRPNRITTTLRYASAGARGAALCGVLFGMVLLASPGGLRADTFPPSWGPVDRTNGPVHFEVLPWPEEEMWAEATIEGIPIIDKRIADPSNGGRAPQNYVNVSSSCTSANPDQVNPSVAWMYNETGPGYSPTPTLFFRWLVEQIPNTYATGPSAQPASSVDPYFSAQWTVLLDIDGDGYREFAVNIAGMSGSPAEPIDMVRSIYSDTRSQSIDYAGDPLVHYLFHQPSAFVDSGTGNILNFQNTLTPVPTWPNGSAERVWDYGQSRVQNTSTSDCNEYVVDFQLPLAMLDATAVGGPRFTRDTPVCMAFVTANSNQNPLQKDVAFDGTKSFTPEDCVPCSDLITLGGGPVVQPVVDEVSTSGCGPTTLTARVRDAIKLNCEDTLAAVEFWYYRDEDANGEDDDGGSWALVGAGTADPANPGAWSATWNTTLLNAGQYLVGVKATDDSGNVTWSWLTTAEAAGLGGTNYANPEGVGVVTDTLRNSCGERAWLAKSVSPAYAPSGTDVTFTLTVRNDTSTPFAVTDITDALPPGFIYRSGEGGTLAGSILSRPAGGATGSVAWTFAGGATVAAGGVATLTFAAEVAADAGTYTNRAAATTDDPDWDSLVSNAVDIGVGDPELTIAKRANVARAVPGDTVTYTLTYANTSPVNATGVVLTDTLPPGLTFVAADGGGAWDQASRTITWQLGSLASGDGPYTLTYQVVVDQGAATRTENVAVIDAVETAPASAWTAIYVPTPLVIAKTADKVLVDPRGASPANQVVYTVAYRNTGTAPLTGVTIADTTVVGFTYASCTGSCTHVEPLGDGFGDDDGACETGEPCTVSWSVGSLAAGASGAVTLTLTVADPYDRAYENPATNVATIDANETGPFSDGASVVVREYDCGAAKDVYYFRDADAAGLPLPWTGAAPGTPLPTTQQRRFARQSPPVSPTAINIVATIPAGGNPSAEIELAHFYQDPPLDRASGFAIAGTVDQNVYVSKDPGGPVKIYAYLYDYNADTGEAVQIGQQAADSGTGLRANSLLSFTISPTGIVREGNLLVWRFTAVRESGNYTGPFTFHYDATGSPASGQVCFAPLSIAMDKTVDKLEAAPGQTLAYTITFSNSGQREVSGATITDTLPPGVTFTGATLNGAAATPVGGTCTAGTPCTFDVRTSDGPAPFPVAGAGSGGILSGGQSGTLVVNVVIDSPLAAGITTLTNIARLENASTDPTEDTATTDVTHLPVPDVFLQKAADLTLLNPGDTVTYTLTATNVGTGTAGNVIVTDTVPADAWFAYVPTSIAGGDSRDDAGAPALTWEITTLAPGDSVTLSFRMQVAAAGVPAGVTYKDNLATVSSDGGTYAYANSNTVRVAITTNANLALAKSVASPAATAAVGTGDGATTTFDAVLAGAPLQAGSVAVALAGARVGVDSGTGVIVGDGLAGATVDYASGAIHLGFLAAPAAGAPITAAYRAELVPGATVDYALAVASTGGSAATGVTVTDPIPAGTSYLSGTLRYDGAAQTDAADGDSAAYDAVTNRVVFTPGSMAADTAHTLSFSVVLDGVLPDGLATVRNTGTAAAVNTASKSASADVAARTAPALAVSKNGPTELPYPVATLNGNHTNATTLTLTSPPGSQYLDGGDRIYVNGLLRTVTSIVSATQVTVDQPVSAGGGTAVLPVIKYTISYANAGTAATTGVRVKDILAAGLAYLGAVPAPTLAPAYDTNGYLVWELGTLAPGDLGTIVVYARPTAVGTYLNGAIMSSADVPETASNTVTTRVGGLLVRKSTSTPAIVNNPADGTPEVATYAIVLAPQTALPVNDVTITDVLPVGFTYRALTSVAGGACGTNPAPGATTAVWVCAVTANPMTITFTVDIPLTSSAGTYQNPVTVTAPGVAVLPFDELETTAEDVTVTIPNDIAVAKVVLAPPSDCPAPTVGTCITYRITARNVGTNQVTGIVVQDRDSTYTTFPPPNLAYASHAPSQGVFDTGTGDWAVGTLNASPTTPSAATLDVTFRITDTFVSSVTNCAQRSAGADTNPANDRICANSLPTLVTLAAFEAFLGDDGVVVAWETATQYLAAGFHLYRLDPAGGEPVRVTERLVPAFAGARQGGRFRVADPGAPTHGPLTYLLAETEATGRVLSYGPFTVVPHASPDDAAGPPSSARPAGAAAERSAARRAAARAETAAALSADLAVGGARTLRVLVESAGLYEIDAASIAALTGIAERRVRAMIRRARFSLTNRGRAVAYRPLPGGAGLLFHGRAVESIYTRFNVYRLAPGPGLRMRTATLPLPDRPPLTTFPERIHLERDETPVTDPMMRADRDFWLWGYALVDGFGAVDLDLPFDVPAPAAGGGPATLTVHLQGWTATGNAPEHHARLRLNGGALIGETSWAGATAHGASFTFDAALLAEGANTLTVEAVLEPGVPVSVFFVDSFDLEYERRALAVDGALALQAAAAGTPITVTGFAGGRILVLDLERPNRPRIDRAATLAADGDAWSVTFAPRSAGARMLVTELGAARVPVLEPAHPTRLRSAGNGGRYLVVAPRHLRPAARAFVEYRRTRGLTGRAIALEDVYDEFNHGIANPWALRAFLRHAAAHWRVPPRYLLLLGDGSLDYRDVLGLGESVVPVLLAETPFGLYPADGRFADFNGDHVPEIAVGRLPVRTSAEAFAYLAKLQAAELLPSRRVIMATDNADEGGNFPADGREVATLVPPAFEVRTVSLEYSAPDVARAQLRREWERGAAVVNYLGHGSIWSLAAEDLLTTEDAAAIAPAGRPPVLAAFTCMIGHFATPGADCLAEELALSPAALGVWSPAGMSYNELARDLDAGLFRAVFARRPVVLGGAVRRALREYRAGGQAPFMMDIYNLLGDPALLIP